MSAAILRSGAKQRFERGGHVKTPICDFVRDYAASDTIRMHMPGHKGRAEDEQLSKIAQYDITEIAGADELFHPTSIIAESEANASEIFGCDTYYSTEGSSLCIRAMLHLCMMHSMAPAATPDNAAPAAASDSTAPAAADTPAAPRPWVLAARNVHESFVSACALLGIDAEWIVSPNITLLSVDIDADDVAKALASGISSHGSLPCCVYITSPDYAGHILPIKEIADSCHKDNVPLVVDNAHGAYLKFLEPSVHPMDLGADMCCDSAHKTLPVLTGGAYLHVASREKFTAERVKNSMQFFASTSPSWLILQSLDRANLWLSEGGKALFRKTEEKVGRIRASLTDGGLSCYGEDTMKITILTRDFGYTGTEFASILREQKIEVEFSDPDMIVLMITPKNTERELEKLRKILLSIPKRKALANEVCDSAFFPEKKMTIRSASLCSWETILLEKALGRIAAMGSFSCPPAVPIVMPGEVIGKEEIASFKYYGYTQCKVVALYSY